MSFLLNLLVSFISLATQPIIIGHRGAPGHLPEHTLESYELAIDFGADFVEPDLVMTKDGVLIARHENEISGTTDVAQKFPDRKKTKTIDGEKISGWFSEDFTLAEIKTLRANERLPFRNQQKNGEFKIVTLQEVIDLVKRKEKEKKRQIGIYPETKHPSYFKSIGVPLETALVKILDQNGYTKRSDPIFIQSFEITNLKELSKITKLRLVQLLDENTAKPYDTVLAGINKTYGDMITRTGLQEIAKYAQGIGPNKRQIIPADANGKLLAPTQLVAMAHAEGLVVHPYTFRSDTRFLAKEYQGDPGAEYKQFYQLGIDGVFSDFADAAIKARQTLVK